MPNFLTGLAYAHLIAGRYETALTLALRATYEAPQYGLSQRVLVAALAMLGRVDEARLAGSRLLSGPIGYYRINETRACALFLDKSFVSRLTDAYRIARLPE